MGIYDRDYYRREGSSFLGPFPGPGQVCKWLITINVVVFIIQILTQTRAEPRFEIIGFPEAPLTLGPFTEWLMLDVHAVFGGQVWRLLTYAFLHDPESLWHIALNMWFLWLFGKDLEDLFGQKEFLAFYLAACVVGGVGFVLLHLAGVPGERCLGASGAVTAVLVLCALHFPQRIILLFFILPVPIWFCVLIQLVPDTFTFIRALRHHEMRGNTAVTVHLAGAAFAYVYYKRQWRLQNVAGGLRAWVRSWSQPRLRVYREERLPPPRPVARPAGPDFDAQMEARVDAVLEKVARSGQDSLTESERELLLRASEVYRKRRT